MLRQRGLVGSFFLGRPAFHKRIAKEHMKLPAKFRTRRLLLTRIEQADSAELIRMHRDPRAYEMLGGARSEGEWASLADELAAHWEHHGFGWWMARDAQSGQLIGRGGLRRVEVCGGLETEVGFSVVPEFQGRGYATELARVAVAQGFVTLGLADVISFTQPGNEASRRVMEKTGLSYERDFDHAGLPHVLYRLAAASWSVMPLATNPGRRAAVAELAAV
jgi:RimJ/RimL family protein N-acetyltransferase